MDRQEPWTSFKDAADTDNFDSEIKSCRHKNCFSSWVKIAIAENGCSMAKSIIGYPGLRLSLIKYSAMTVHYLTIVFRLKSSMAYVRCFPLQSLARCFSPWEHDVLKSGTYHTQVIIVEIHVHLSL